MSPLVNRLLAVVGLLITFPAMVLSAVGIKIASPGPVLYRSQRAGQGGVPFTMVKLRTMHIAQSTSSRITGGKDPRVFRLGAFLRRAKLDEIPQLINVARGDMTFVGPRPEDVTIVTEHYDAMMHESLSIPPGITGPGCLHYFADEASLPDDADEAEQMYLSTLLPRKIALDLVYVRNRSFRYEMQLIFRTLARIIGLSWIFRNVEEAERADARRILKDHHWDGVTL